MMIANEWEGPSWGILCTTSTGTVGPCQGCVVIQKRGLVKQEKTKKRKRREAARGEGGRGGVKRGKV